MFDTYDFDMERAVKEEKHALIANTQAQLLTRRAESLYIARAIRQVVVNGVENVKGRPSVDGA